MAEPTPPTQPEKPKKEEQEPTLLEQMVEAETRGAYSAPGVRADLRSQGYVPPRPAVLEYSGYDPLEHLTTHKTGLTTASGTGQGARNPFPQLSREAEPIGLPARTNAAGQPQTRQPIDYGSTEEPPAGWNPEPQEIDRLVEAGLLDRRDSADNNVVWQAGRADLGRRGGKQWVDVSVAREMITDVERGESAVQKSLWSEVPVSMIRGLPVINTYEMFTRAQDIWYSKILDEKGVTPLALDDATIKEYRQEAKRRAARTMTRVMQSGGRRYWADPLEKDLTDDIMKSYWWWRPIRALASPVRFGAAGRGGPDSHLDALGRSQLVLSSQQLKYENPLVTIGRFAPSTLVSASISTGHWPWEREAIEAVRAGEDIIYHVGDIAQAISGTEAGGDSPLWADITAGLLTVGVIITEPDAISMALTGPGAVMKHRKVQKMNRRLAKVGRLAGPLADAVREGRIAVPDAAARLQELDEAVATAVEMGAGAEARMGGVINKKLHNLYEQSADLQAEAARKRAQVDDLVSKYTGEHAERTAAKLNAEADELDYAGAVFGALAAEAEKNAFLMARGLGWEAAERITTRGKVPTNSQAAVEARRNAKLFETRAEDLRKANKAAFQNYEEASRNFIENLETLARNAHEGKTKPVGVVTLSRELKTARTGETYRAPMIGQEVAWKTERGGTRRGIVEGIEVRGPAGKRFPKKPPTTAPEGGYTVVVKVKTSKGIETVETPYRIDDWTIGHGLNLSAKEYMKHHRVIAFRGGPLDQIHKFENAATDARAFAVALEEGGPSIGAVTRYEEAIKTLNDARKKAKASAKTLGSHLKAEEEIFEEWLKVKPEALKAEMKAELAEDVPRIYGDAIETVVQGLENFRVQGLERLGMEGLKPSRVPSLLQVWKARKLDMEDVKAFGSQVNDVTVERTYRELVAKHFAHDGATRTSKIEADALREDLENVVGKAFLDDIIDGAPMVKKALEEGGPVSRSFDETAKIQEEIRELIRVGEANQLYQSNEIWGRAIFSAWQDLNLVKTKGGTLTLWGSRLNRLARQYSRMGKNVATRIGEAGPELESAIIEIDRLFSRAQLELSEVARSEKLGDTPGERMIVFLDATTTLPLKEGMTRWMVATGGGSIFGKAQVQILSDTRMNPLDVERRADAIRTLREDLTRKISGDIADVVRVDGEVLEGDALRKLISDGLTDDLLFRLSMKGEGGPGGVPKSLVALSHMWVPGYSLKTFDSAEGAMLLGAAQSILRSSKTYEEFSGRMKKVTHAILGDSAANTAKAHASGASGCMLAATLGEFGYRIDKIIGGKITVEEAADINRIFSGSYGEVANLDRSLDILNKLGMPFTQAEVRELRGVTNAVGELGVKSKELIEVGSKSGKPSFVPRALIEEVEKRAGRIAKDLRARNIESRVAAGGRDALSTYLSLWRGSAVTGLIIPNPRYWTNNIFGDFSQLWIGEGLGFAARRSFINFPANIPMFGRAMQSKSLYLAERVAGKSGRGNALPGIIETFFNPHLGAVFAGKSGEFVTKNGDIITYDQLRRMALEDGISETFVREELMEMYSKVVKDSGSWKAAFHEAGEWNKAIADHANLVQERQRVGMYADLIQRGVPRAEAAKRTKRALYDWSHGIAEWEARTIARLIPFWRFWRLSLAQCADALIDPMVRPAGQTFGKAMLGNTKAARLRQQLLIWPSLPDFFVHREDRPGMSTQAKIDMLARELYPDWQDTRAKLGVVPIDPRRRRYWEEMYGRQYTHESILLPTTTATDSMDMLFGLMVGLGSVTASVAKHIPVLKNILPEFETVGDWESKFWEPVLSSTNPFIETPVRAALQMAGADLDYSITGDWKYLNPTDEEVWRFSKGLFGEMQYDRARGRWKVPTSSYLWYRMLPVAPTQISGWMGAVRNPDWDEGFFAGSTTMLRKLTRFGDIRPFNANDTLKGRIYEINDQFKKFEERNGDIRRVDRSLRTRGDRD